MKRLASTLLALVAACTSSWDPVIDGSSSAPADAAPDDDDGDEGDGAPAGAGCADRAAQPLDATWTIDVDGVTRAAEVHVPASYQPGTPTAVVLNLHGRTQNADSQASLSHAIARSDAAGFVLVHPESSTAPTSWNAGTCCDPAVSADVDDVGFIAALLDELEARLCVDPDRVYAMGMSNGAYLAHRLACEMADRIAAIGPVAGLHLQSPCTPSRPVAAFLVNGTDDTLSQYQYVDEGVDFWVAVNGCTTSAQTYQNGDATCVTHGGCDDDADVVLCTIDGGGHQWPGGGTLPFLGTKSNDLVATDALWDFFATH